MKNNTLKNKFGLYKEGILQSKVIGVPFVCFGALMTIFDLLNELFTETEKGIEAGHVAMLIVSMISTPLTLLMLFHFLNSRKASDFYHSIPRSRSSLYLSFGAAAVTWPIVVVTAMTAVEMLTYLMFGHAVNFAEFGQILLAAISSNIFIAGAVMLAISISSTVFSQVVISGLIIFLPRVLVACFEDAVTDIVPILPSFEQAIGIIGAPWANIIIGLAEYDLSGDALWQAALYSLFIGIAYAALGMLFFCRRKSESAAQPALNRWVQMGIRVTIAFVICLIPTIELAKELNRGEVAAFSEPELMFVLYGIALIAYFVYEAISVRSIRGMWKSWPELIIGLVVLAALNLGFIYGAGLSADAVLRFQPEADEIASISFPIENRYTTYSQLRVAETELTDEELNSFMAEKLCGNVQNIDIINDGYGYDYDASYDNHVLVQFTMKDGSKVTRYIYMSFIENADMERLLSNNEDYVSAAMDYPEDYQELLLNGDSEILTDEQLAQLYDVYTAELEEMEYTDLFSDKIHVIADLYVNGRYKGHAYSSYYPIYLETPNSLQTYIEMTKTDESLSNVIAKMQNASYYNIGVCGYNFYNDGVYYEQHGNSYDFYGDLKDEYGNIYDSELWEKLIAELLDNENKPVDITKPFYVVNISVEHMADDMAAKQNGSETYAVYRYEDYEFFVQASEENSCLELPEFVAGYEYEYEYR